MGLSQLPITAQMVIPESYLDSMGHMNVMWYTHLFGKSMGGLFKLFGLDHAYFRSGKAGTFALKQLFNYRVEVRVGEQITIRGRALGRTAKRLHVIHFMTKGEPEVLSATAEVISAHIDMTTRRTSPFPDEIATNFDRIAAAHAALAWASLPRPELTI